MKNRKNEITTGLWILDSKSKGCDGIENTTPCMGKK